MCVFFGFVYFVINFVCNKESINVLVRLVKDEREKKGGVGRGGGVGKLKDV